MTTLGYGGVVNAARFAAHDRECALRVLDMPRPGAPVEQFYDTVISGLSETTRVLIVDHLSAQTALILPIAEIAEECHRRGVLVFADGADCRATSRSTSRHSASTGTAATCTSGHGRHAAVAFSGRRPSIASTSIRR